MTERVNNVTPVLKDNSFYGRNRTTDTAPTYNTAGLTSLYVKTTSQWYLILHTLHFQNKYPSILRP